MKIKVIFRILSVFTLLFFISCGGGGGGGSDTPSGNSDNIPPTTGDDTTEDDSSDDTFDSSSLPVPETIPVPLNEGSKPILTGNIFSKQNNFLYLVDDSKPVQTESNVLYDIKPGFRVSPNGQYLAFVPYGESTTLISDLEGNLLYSASDAFTVTWLPDSNILYADRDLRQIRFIDLAAKTDSIVYQFEGEEITDVDSLAVSHDGNKIAWAVHYNDYEIEIQWANFDGKDISGTPQIIWNGITEDDNASCGLNFISSTKFIFFLSQLNEDGGGDFDDYIFQSDATAGSTEKIAPEFTMYNIAVSNSGKYVAFTRVHSVYLVNTQCR